MQVTVHKAKTNLSQLIESALAGEEVIIAKGNRPVVRLTPIRPKGFRFGVLVDVLKDAPPDFLAPMNKDELRLWHGGE